MAITIKNLQTRIRIPHRKIRDALLATLAAEGVMRPCRINVCFVSDSEIKKINYRYREVNRPTDVLAFDMSGKEREGICAEIVISAETAVRNSLSFGTLPVYEACLYAVHGLLHILGYDDKKPGQRKLMQDKAEHILKKCL